MKEEKLVSGQDYVFELDKGFYLTGVVYDKADPYLDITFENLDGLNYTKIDKDKALALIEFIKQFI